VSADQICCRVMPHRIEAESAVPGAHQSPDLLSMGGHFC
jgi:hypothetical protein